MSATEAIRSAAALIVGVLSISLIVEPIEFLLVAGLNNGITTDPEVYFAIRNQPSMLAAKVVYNFFAAVAGGWLVGWVAGRQEVLHGMALAFVQTISFVFALTVSQFADSTPLWMWLVLIVITVIGVMWGARLRAASVATAARP